MRKQIALLLVLSGMAGSQCSGAIIISQYYEGIGTSKWIELFNNGPTSINLNTVAVGLWTNASAEGYKTNAAATQAVTLSGTLNAGATFVLGNTGNANLGPNHSAANLNSNSVINFNGNDSVAIYTAGTFSTANLLDAIGFTNAGNQGVDRSFVRISSAAGFNTTAGSNVTNFGTVWSQVSLATVNAASAGSDNSIGFSSLPFTSSSVPEPSSIAFLSFVGCSGLAAAYRRRRKVEGSDC